ncbi:hypothetical protein BEST7613_5460 [Synechocystis sp. PCC 6803]|nr:hypothetical protein BEST7613_5460 [Synechocystis sp. PCC 6803] [Bacillus subtilis BEST7613]
MTFFTRLDYCQYLLSSPTNYTLTNLAKHLDGVSHDRIKRYLQGVKLTPLNGLDGCSSQSADKPL